MKIRKILAICGALTLSASPASAQTIQVDADLPSYEKVSGISGNLNSIGSDTLNNLMTLWAEGFKKVYPNVNVQIEGKGSSTAPPALIEATAQIGPMSRAMKSKEMDEFEKKFGYKPTPIRTSLDSLAVFVNKDNPVQGLNIQQVDALFSKNRKCGATLDTRDLGRPGSDGQLDLGPDQPVRPEFRLGHLRLLQEGRAVQGRLQGYGERAAGFGFRGPGRERRPQRRGL